MSNTEFYQERYMEYLDEGYEEDEAQVMAQLDIEEAGDAVGDF